jgi:hypothetical protein
MAETTQHRARANTGMNPTRSASLRARVMPTVSLLTIAGKITSRRSLNEFNQL